MASNHSSQESRMSNSDDQLSADLASLRIRQDNRPARAPVAASGGRSFPMWPIVLVLTLAIVGGGGWVLYQKVLKNSLLAPEVSVTQVVMVRPGQTSQTLVATGYLVAERQAVVAPKVAGRVDTLSADVDPGKQVKAGEVLCTLDRSDVEAQLASAGADSAAARAQVDKATADLDSAQVTSQREDDLVARGAVGSADATDAQLKMQSSKAALGAAQAQAVATGAKVDVLQAQLNDLSVRAPFDGTVLKRSTQVGETLVPGTGSVCTIADMTSIEAEADVSEAQLGKIKAGQPVEIQLDAMPDQTFPGSVDAIVPDVDRSKATATVKVKFDALPDNAFPDMAAKVSFLDHPVDAATLAQPPVAEIPSAAVVVRDGVAAVLVVGDGERLRETPVVVGDPEGDMVALKNGPAEGTKIVADPTPELHDGQVVKEKAAGD
jgi:RND family efflux transporter MFP subunit